MINKFDLNQELSELSFESNVFEYYFLNSTIKVLYHAHRLGSRVPLFLFSFENRSLYHFFSTNFETLDYFRKLGSIICLDLGEHLPSRCDLLKFILKKYGSIYTIVFCFDDIITKNFESIILESQFLKSEVKAIVSSSDTKVRYLSMRNEYFTICDSSNDSAQLRNAKIHQFLQETLEDDCLDWNWQFEQSDKLFLRDQLVLKNLDKWKATESAGVLVEGTPFIPMKLMHDRDGEHNLNAVLSRFKDVGMIIDLSNDEGSYDKTPLKQKNIIFKRMQLASKVVPSSKDISFFIDMVDSYVCDHPFKKIIVHCHYGYNRTGLMICAYMIAKLGVPIAEAINRFKNSRPPGIKHQNFIDKLYLRFESGSEEAIQ